MDKERKKEYRALGDKAQASAIGRGAVLTLVTDIEDLLTSIIAWCFSPIYEELDGEVDSLLSETAIALKSIILRKVDFSEKITLLVECVQFTDDVIYKSNRKLIKQVTEELDNIRKFRNLLAHSRMDTSKEYIEQLLSWEISDSDSFQVLEYKLGKVHRRNISFDVLKGELHRTTVTWHKLLQLWALLRKRPDEAREHEIMSTISADEGSKIMERMGYT
jgi:hypothetical protein